VIVNERLDRLGDNPFARLADLFKSVTPRSNRQALALSVRDPQHQPPALLAEAVARHGNLWNLYPPIIGTAEFRTTVSSWLTRRYHLAPGLVDPDRHVLALAGSKEGLFLAATLTVPEGSTAERASGRPPVVLLPNPFYLVYAGSGVMAGGEPVFLPSTAETGFLPDLAAIPRDVLARTALFYLCTPANPQGVIADLDYLKSAITLARTHDFTLVIDECYAEIWDQAPPPGGLEACQALGPGASGDAFENVLVFHSLSKRSNAAGLRSGFVAGDARLIQKFAKLRSFGGTQIPLPIQAAATALWQDEAHVEANRAAYRLKFDAAERVLGDRFGFYRPPGGFFLWLDVGDSERVAAALWREAAIRTLPGLYLGRAGADGNHPGARYLRIALVHEPDVIADALDQLVRLL
jgi:aspartate/methionine/tyrosine aminotransferase